MGKKMKRQSYLIGLAMIDLFLCFSPRMSIFQENKLSRARFTRKKKGSVDAHARMI
jgi:hypothetical protein